MEQYTYIGFLLTATIGLASFVVWLVKKVISLTEKSTDTHHELKGAISSLGEAVKNNTKATDELRYSINNKQ